MKHFSFTLVVALLSPLSLFGATRSDYLDIIESAVDAYTPERRAAYIGRVEREGITEHGFARLTANIGTLVSNGRRGDLKDEFIRMMDICAREQPVAEKRNGSSRGGHRAVGSEFAVKELVFAVVEAERSGRFPKEKTDAWRTAFTPMVAAEIYSQKPKPGDPVARNWTIFGTASEQARIEAGMGGDAAWVEKYVADQLRFFDSNGMYRDPGCPMVYDFVTRLQYAVTLDCGYDGPSRAKLESLMELSAEPTLAMQSVTGEIPFGGRSNQFLHNETFCAALCEWYAAHDKKCGNAERARRFRRAADRAAANVKRHLEERPISHVKNRFPVESGYGCEDYAYFDKYMVTMGSWAYLAMRFADESIPLAADTDDDSVFVTSSDFHRVMLNAHSYTLQFDLAGQDGYDATGLGRVLKKGAPAPLALSVPFPVDSHYRLDVTNECPLAIGPRGVEKLEIERCSSGEAIFCYPGGRWLTTVVRSGAEMTVEQPGDVAFALPAFITDGGSESVIVCDGRVLSIAWRGWVCRYETDGEIVDVGKVFGNRNGYYRLFEARGRNRIRVRASIERERIVMDTNMNQFDPNPSRFESPAFQKGCGFNAVALRMNGLPLAVTALYDGYDSRVFSEGSDARKWVLAVREQFAAKIREAKAAGLAVFVNTDVIVLPRRMKELYKDEICRPDGRIDFMKPKTLEIHRALIGEFFDTFPELDGIVVRTGETYTFKTPFHGGNGPCDYKNDLEGSKAAHAALMNLLREEVCVKRGKTCIYRTWDFGYFHARPDYYLDVVGRVRPHEKFIISIKHCAADFFRGIDFNRTLGLGEHPQIVEVQCQREYEGKGAFPSYIADSVINGFEENEESPEPHTLRDFAASPLFAGVWTWSRGGGWVGPCIKNEFWCELNARVMANWANGEQETEEGCFRKAAEAMGIMPEFVDALHHLALLTPKAILRGKLASDTAAAKGLPVGWVRDCYLAGINTIIGADWLYNCILDGSIEGILADRRESVRMWEEIVDLAKAVRCRDKADESYILTSSIYGLRLFRMIEAGWDVMATGLKGDMFGHVYDTARLKAAIERYDRAKAEYMNLPKERPDAATLFTDQYVRIKVREAFHEVTPVPGLGETVDRYRMHLKEE